MITLVMWTRRTDQDTTISGFSGTVCLLTITEVNRLKGKPVLLEQLANYHPRPSYVLRRLENRIIQLSIQLALQIIGFFYHHECNVR